MIAAEITGSVGVRQADMAKQEIKLSDGKSSNMNPWEYVQLNTRRGKEECTHQQRRTTQSPSWGRQAPVTLERVPSYKVLATRLRSRTNRRLAPLS